MAKRKRKTAKKYRMIRRTFTIRPHHLKRLESLRRRWNLDNVSQALRELVEGREP